MKKKLAFVDHSFHKFSHSGDFLREILSKEYAITDFWDDQWKGGNSVSPDMLNNYDVIFYFQAMNPYNEILKIHRPMYWAPMYDGVRFDFPYWKLLSFTQIRILAFSEKVAGMSRLANIPFISLKYFLKPNFKPLSSRPPYKVFFWERGNLSLENVLKHLNPTDISQFLYLSQADPSYHNTKISKSKVKEFKIRERKSKGFLSKTAYLALVDECDIFIAPRLKEGIGMSFLEALSMGKCVIAYDDATMNEYIQHAYNGYLFSTKNISCVDTSQLATITRNSRKSVTSGYKRWLIQKKQIVKFIDQPTTFYARTLLTSLRETTLLLLWNIYEVFFLLLVRLYATGRKLILTHGPA